LQFRMSDRVFKYLVAAASICIIARTAIDFAAAIVPKPPKPTREEQARHVIRESCKQFKYDDQLYAKCWATTRLRLEEKGVY
jgi:hypothetical protein